MKVRIWMLTLCLLTGLSTVLAQTITVKGNVVDENGEALPGVSIVPKSAPKTGTVSKTVSLLSACEAERNLRLVSWAITVKSWLPHPK